MKFKAKVDLWFHAVCVVMLAFTIFTVFLIFFGKYIILNIILSVFCLALSGLLLIPMWLNTSYFFAETSLIIKSGLITRKIPYKNINSIKESKSAMASSALSMDRIEIAYNKFDIIVIAPKNKHEFIKQLEERTK